MTTGERIKKARKAAGLTQKELGEKLGVSGAMIGQYETGSRTPKYDTIVKISGALGISPYALYGADTLSDSSLDYFIDLLSVLKTLQFIRDNPSSPLPVSDFITNMFPQLDALLSESGSQAFNILSAVYAADSPETREIVKFLLKLNDSGKRAAVSRIEELTEIPRYQSKDDKASSAED